MNSTHKCEVFKIDNIQKHPNADKLSIVNFYNYQCIIRTEDFKEGDLAVYIPPDNCVDISHPSFEFLKVLGKSPRIKAQKLRGVVSQGLVMKAPAGYNEGDDLSQHWGITHYVPSEKVTRISDSSRWIEAPPYSGEYYDIDSWFRYGRNVFIPGEMVLITEKIHGMNVRYTYQLGEYHVCSRKFWREESSSSIYWKILNERKWLKKLLKQNPNLIVYGEIFGKGIQDLEYGRDKPDFLIFDIYCPHESSCWLSWENCEYLIEQSLKPSWVSKWFNKLFPNIFQIPNQNARNYMVPIIARGIYSEPFILSLISGKSLLDAEDIREGIVIKPVNERLDMKIGRVILKAVSPEYLEKGN